MAIKFSLSVFIAAAVMLGAVSAQSGGPATSAYAGIVADPDYSTLAKMIKAGGSDPFITSLRDPTLSATIFAPTNSAFSKASASLKAVVNGGSPSDIVRILKQHVVVGTAVSGNQLKQGLILTSALGQKLTVSTGYLYGTYVSGPKNKVRVIPSNNLVGRSYVHKADGVIIPK